MPIGVIGEFMVQNLMIVIKVIMILMIWGLNNFVSWFMLCAFLMMVWFILEIVVIIVFRFFRGMVCL